MEIIGKTICIEDFPPFKQLRIYYAFKFDVTKRIRVGVSKNIEDDFGDENKRRWITTKEFEENFKVIEK